MRDFRIFAQKNKTKRKKTMESATKAAMFNALAWIDAKKKDAEVDAENVDVGVQCLRCVRVALLGGEAFMTGGILVMTTRVLTDE